MATSQRMSPAELARRLDTFEERLHRAERDRGDMSAKHRAEVAGLQGRASALRARLHAEAVNGDATSQLEADWNGLFSSFEAWIARLDERQERFNL